MTPTLLSSPPSLPAHMQKKIRIIDVGHFRTLVLCDHSLLPGAWLLFPPFSRTCSLSLHRLAWAWGNTSAALLAASRQGSSPEFSLALFCLGSCSMLLPRQPDVERLKREAWGQLQDSLKGSWASFSAICLCRWDWRGGHGRSSWHFLALSTTFYSFSYSLFSTLGGKELSFIHCKRSN